MVTQIKQCILNGLIWGCTRRIDWGYYLNESPDLDKDGKSCHSTKLLPQLQKGLQHGTPSIVKKVKSTAIVFQYFKAIDPFAVNAWFPVGPFAV